MRESEEARAYYEAMLQQLTYINTHTSTMSERLMTGVVNGVLEGGTRIIDASGAFMLQFGATVGSFEIHNTSDTTIVVAGGPPSAAPIQGAGVYRIGPRTWRIVNINNRTVSVYGLAGTVIGYQAFTRGGLFGGGSTGAEASATGVALTGASQLVAAAPTVGVGGTLHYQGFTIRETAAAVATVRIWDNTAASGRLLDTIALTASQSAREFYPDGVRALNGIFVEIVAGTVEGSIRYT